MDPAFIPLFNEGNQTPHLREYPQWKALHQKHTGSLDYWGMPSWRWHQKTGIPGLVFRDWIVRNPGYDVYHIDPFNFKPGQPYANLWTQGDRWHPGLVDFANDLFKKTSLFPIGIYDIRMCNYLEEEFITANYYIGNTVFWDAWIKFLDNTLEVCNNDPNLKAYLFEKGGMYNGHWVPNFPFVTERLSSYLCYLARKNNIYHLKILKFPMESISVES